MKKEESVSQEENLDQLIQLCKQELSLLMENQENWQYLTVKGGGGGGGIVGEHVCNGPLSGGLIPPSLIMYLNLLVIQIGCYIQRSSQHSRVCRQDYFSSESPIRYHTQM